MAGPLDGDYSLEIGGENEVWYPDGDDDLPIVEDGDTIDVVTTGAVTSATGGVTATGMFSLHFPGLIDMDLPIDFTGQTSGTTKKRKAKVAFAGSGSAVLHDDQLGDLTAPTTANGSLTCKHPSPHATEFECRGRVRMCFVDEMSGGRKFCDHLPMFAMFNAAGGPWTLGLSVATDPDGRVTGSATTTLANGAAQSHSVTGKYNAKKDTSTLKVRTLELGSKDKVDASKLLESLDAGKLTFKIAGQTGKVTLVPGP
jgi:hypothetical protein